MRMGMRGDHLQAEGVDGEGEGQEAGIVSGWDGDQGWGGVGRGMQGEAGKLRGK